MPGPITPIDLDNAIQLYLSGQSVEQITADTGVSYKRLNAVRVARGIPPRPKAILPNVNDVAADYVAGVSMLALAHKYGVTRPTLRKQLVDHGIEIRSGTDANLIRMARQTPDERDAMTRAAHAATLGSKRTMDTMARTAATREQMMTTQSAAERQFSEWLAARGIEGIPQLAVGKYNVDLAVPPVAVEILGGGWHSHKRTHATRTPYILDQGWHLLFVWNYEGRSALIEDAADYLVTFLQEIRRDPPTVGQYRVITGHGDLLAAGSANDDQFTLKPPPRGRTNVRAGNRYSRREA